MSITLDANASFRSTERLDELEKSSLDEPLIRQLKSSGADGWNLWSVDDRHMLVRLGSWGQTSESLLRASADLASRALSAGEPKTCLLSSPASYLLIAQPIENAVPKACLTVSFPCELQDLCREATADQFRAVEELAQMVAESTCPNRTVRSDAEPNGNGHQESHEDSNQWLPWRELARHAIGKLKLEVSKHLGRVRFYAIGTISLLLLAAMPFPYRIHCSVTCEPMVRRYVAAPFDARLESSHVVAGERVVQGQRLATLDGGDLRSELAGLRAKSAQTKQALLAALSAGDHSKAEMERLESEQIAREIELLENRQSRLDICSPIDGIVITGDLERAQGTPLSMGDNLYEIASLDHFIAEIAIDEADVSQVDEEMDVTISLESAPGDDGMSKIRRVHLRNEIRDHRSVYLAEAELENEQRKLRPGMNGKATIHAGYRSLGWVLFHRPYYVVRHWIGW